jgi:hypothetical protein
MTLDGHSSSPGLGESADEAASRALAASCRGCDDFLVFVFWSSPTAAMVRY